MVKNILGTPYEKRKMYSHLEINGIEDIINATGIPYVKAKLLLPEQFKTGALTIDQVSLFASTYYNFRHLINEEVNWEGTQMLGVGAISPVSGYYFLQVFYKDMPIETRTYFWGTDKENKITNVVPPRPCTRELDIVHELTKFYSELIRTNCSEADLRKYAKSWPKDRVLV